MKSTSLIFALILLVNASWGQVSTPIEIKWTNHLSGNFSFRKNWSYPLGVDVKKDGKAGCADGGLCPERCYSMLDSNGIVLKDSAHLFYQLLDTTHQFHTISCDALCSEFGGTNFIEAIRINKDSIFCHTVTDIATHCSLKLGITGNTCTATIQLNSIIPNGDMTYYCNGGFIEIDKKFWKKGILKSNFNFTFTNKKYPQHPLYWKGKTYAPFRI